MGDQTSYFRPADGVEVPCTLFYQHDLSEVPSVFDVRDWLAFTYRQFPRLPLMAKLKQVAVWSSSRADRPVELQGLNPRESQYDPVTQTIHILSGYARRDLVLHEYGHHLAWLGGMRGDGFEPGKSLLAAHAVARPDPKPEEKLAEDFKEFCNGTGPAWLGDFFRACAAMTGGF
jgi:hypothetical protein